MYHSDTRSSARQQCGVTLVELLVVLVVLGLALSIVAPFFSSGSLERAARRASWDVAAALRETRSGAITNNIETVFVLDPSTRIYRSGRHAEPRALPPDLDVRVLAAESEVAPGGGAGVRFFPDGSSTGGRITITAGTVSYLIGVHWLTGRVEVRHP